MPKIVVMTPDDNVGTCLRSVPAGSVVEASLAERNWKLTANSAIPFGHKIALTDIPEGQRIVKYGETIGLASCPIASGDHVHVHNVESIRARGDKFTGEVA